MSVSPWQVGERPQLKTNVVVIGAGLVGCAAAWYLKQKGQQVILVDKWDVGLGASSRNAGFLLTGLDTYYQQAQARYGKVAARHIWEYSQQTHRFWWQMGRQHNVPMRASGSWLLAETSQEAEDLSQAAQAMQADGLTCQFYENAPIGQGYQAALHQPNDGEVHPYQLVKALYAASDAQLIPNCEVYDIQATTEGVHVAGQRASIQADYALICTNGYAKFLHPYFDDKLTPHRAQCLITEPVSERIFDGVGYSDYGNMYYRQLEDGRFLIGGGRKQHAHTENDTIEDRPNEAVQGFLTEYLAQHFPIAALVMVQHRWAGIMGFTPDGLPLVGTLPQMARVGFAVGLNGHGLSLGAAVAEAAVKLLLDQDDPGVFHAGRLTRNHTQN